MSLFALSHPQDQWAQVTMLACPLLCSIVLLTDSALVKYTERQRIQVTCWKCPRLKGPLTMLGWEECGTVTNFAIPGYFGLPGGLSIARTLAFLLYGWMSMARSSQLASDGDTSPGGFKWH